MSNTTYVFVGDVVEAAVRAIASEKSGTGTSEPESRRRSTASLSSSPALGFQGKPDHAPLAPGEQRRSVLDSSAVRRDLGAPPWTPVEKGIGIIAEAFRGARPLAAS